MADQETLAGEPADLIEHLAELLGVDTDVLWTIHLYNLPGEILLTGPQSAVKVKCMGDLHEIMRAGFEQVRTPPAPRIIEAASLVAVPSDRMAVTCVPCGQVLSCATDVTAPELYLTGHGYLCRRNHA